jgi:tRNA modification GTPase
MNAAMSGWDDTIVALATPPGVGAIGVIRLSGNKALSIIDQLAPDKKLSAKPSHTLHFVHLKQGDRILDEAVVALYKSPKSYTGEDVVEISCHGSSYILQEVISLCINYGARQAHPGEFTQRAFLNGKMDLAQAEAVADVINAETKAAQRAAMNQLRGGFSGKLSELREQLINFAALIELELDFSEEDVEFADRAELKKLVREITEETEKLIQSFQLGNVVKNGVRVAIIGKPNAGKSTLLNALLNEERAIVSDIPGTTRDTIEEVLNIKGILFRLIDTAGIRDHSTDEIENLGIKRSRINAEQADLILRLKDMTDKSVDHDLSWLDKYADKTIVVSTKFDLWMKNLNEMGIDPIPDFSLNPVSARDGFGIQQLKDKMFESAVTGGVQIEGHIVTNARHFEALQHMRESLAAIKKGLKERISGDLLTPDIRRCLYHLGTITGQVETDRDILGTIFGKFCIGK